MDLGADQVVIEETGEIAEGETLNRSLHTSDRTVTTDQAEVIGKIELSDLTDLISRSVLTIPAAGMTLSKLILLPCSLTP